MGWSAAQVARGLAVQAGTITIPAGQFRQALNAGWDVTNYSALFVSCTQMTAGAVFELHTAADSSFAQPLQPWSWTIGQNTQLQVIVPLIGNFVKAFFTTLGNGGHPFTEDFWVQPINLATPAVVYPVTNNVISAAAKNLNAGVTDTYYPAWIQPGPAGLTFQPNSGTAFVLQLQLVNSDGSFGAILYSATNPTAQIVQQVVLPDQPFAITVTNNAGSPQLYTLGLTPGGGH